MKHQVEFRGFAPASAIRSVIESPIAHRERISRVRTISLPMLPNSIARWPVKSMLHTGQTVDSTDGQVVDRVVSATCIRCSNGSGDHFIKLLQDINAATTCGGGDPAAKFPNVYPAPGIPRVRRCSAIAAVADSGNPAQRNCSVSGPMYCDSPTLAISC